MIRVKGNLFIRFRDIGLSGSDETVPHIHRNGFYLPSLNGILHQFPTGVSAYTQQTINALNAAFPLQVNGIALELSDYSGLLVSTRPEMNCFTLCSAHLAR
jgi:hypothetical protein